MPPKLNQGSVLVKFSHRDRPIRISLKSLEQLVRFVARREGFNVGVIDLAIVGQKEIGELNRRYLQHAGPTDVLSFDLSDSATPGLSAQIIVCDSVAAHQGRLRGLRGRDELMLYVIHGLLHVMGYDDTSIRQSARMSARQEELLREFVARSS